MKKTIFLSLGYWFSSYTLGLLVHPYKTMREFIRHKSFRPLILVPLVTWSLGWVLGMAGLRFGGSILRLVGVGVGDNFVFLLAFLFFWFSFFMLFWQIVLLYLFLRLKSSLETKS